MLREFRWLALAAVVAAAALVAPTAALADGCNDGSATSIYTECVQKADGGKKHPTKHAQTGTPAPSTQQTQPTSPPPVSVRPQVHVSSKTQHAIDRSGKDKNLLKNLATNSNLVDTRHLKPVLASSRTGESNLGSAFDLGAGPMILFALLAGTVLLLLGTGGVRSWRNRHRV
jgi:hypothetical protein